MVVGAGTAGDTMPMLRLSEYLRCRGHVVTLVSAPVYADFASRWGMDFVPVSALDAHERSLDDMVLLNTRYTSLFFERHALGWNRAIFSSARRLAASRPLILCNRSGMLWADLIAYASLGLPVVRMAIDPPLLVNPLPQFSQIRPGRIQRFLFARFETKWRAMARELGLTAGFGQAERLMRRAGRNIPIIGLWPHWLTAAAGKATEFPVFGFLTAPTVNSESPGILFDPRCQRRLIVFVLGSLGTRDHWVHEFIAVSVEICRQLGCNGLLLGAGNIGTPPAMATQVVSRKFIPLAQVLPHASALVHHGGIGTAAAAVAHSTPQLIVPRLFSQPSNAEYMRRLGLGVVLRPECYTAGQGISMLRMLLTDDSYRRRAVDFARQTNAEEQARELCNLLEGWKDQRAPTEAPQLRATGGLHA